MKVAYLGPVGTFSEKMARKLFPDAELIDFPLNVDVTLAVEEGKADRAVVAVENIKNGEVREVLDTLTECEHTKIIGESFVEVVHWIGALPNHGELKEVYSKDQALEQCRKYLRTHYKGIRPLNWGSTADAARHIAENKLMHTAAIASRTALESHGLKILAEDICPDNRTRFFILGDKDTEPTGNDKTFVSFHPRIRDKEGVINTLTGFFRKINMETLLSRPDGEGGYLFYVELDGHFKEDYVAGQIEKAARYLDPSGLRGSVKVFGSYANSHWKEFKKNEN